MLRCYANRLRDSSKLVINGNCIVINWTFDHSLSLSLFLCLSLSLKSSGWSLRHAKSSLILTAITVAKSNPFIHDWYSHFNYLDPFMTMDDDQM